MSIQSPWQYFSVYELTCHGIDCGCDHGLHMDEDFMRMMVQIRRELGLPLPVISGYRCGLHNSEVSKTGTDGPHTQGKAMDIAIYGARAFQLVDCALRYPIHGIGIKQNGSYGSRYIHLDSVVSDKRPRIWSY